VLQLICANAAGIDHIEELFDRPVSFQVFWLSEDAIRLPDSMTITTASSHDQAVTAAAARI
jgi:hypothetical protein